ncbi:MAG TPA: hypothetical protein VFY16_12250 [Gemmatimonadaceae bacterium]|nr:hypothetical protein [Gemmatimonadaceae bacterium]
MAPLGWLGALLSLSAVTWARDSGAQPVPIVRLTAENDYFDFFVPPGQRPDYEYTHGTRITFPVSVRTRAGCTRP